MEFSDSQLGTTKLTQMLAEMNAEGGFEIAVLTDKDGLPIASATIPGEDTDRQSAVVALVQRTAVQVSDRLGMAATDEISVFDAQGRRLVCRPFDINGHEMILAVLIPDKQKKYRRLTNQAVLAIRQMISTSTQQE
ncbi:MAG: roadblock/LC7 domain-containing protein [Anaerolineae bacterium]